MPGASEVAVVRDAPNQGTALGGIACASYFGPWLCWILRPLILGQAEGNVATAPPETFSGTVSRSWWRDR